MRAFLVFMLSLYFSAAIAATVRWPGAAACSGTLTDCMNSSQDGDTIEMTTNASISGFVFVNRAVSLTSAPGIRANIFGDGIFLFQVAPATPWLVKVQDMAIQNVLLRVLVRGSAAGRVDFANVSFADANSNGQFHVLIDFDQTSNLRNIVSIRNCRFLAPAVDGSFTSVYVSNSQSSSPAIDAVDNIFVARQVTGANNFRGAFSAAANGGSTLSSWEIEFARNRVVGYNEVTTSRLAAGFGLTAFADSAVAVNVHDNVFLLDRMTTGAGTAILAVAQGGDIKLRALNNTIKDANYAIGLGKNAGGLLSAKIDNNIMFNGFRALEVETLVATDLAQRKNLVFGFPNPGTVALAADTLLLDPMLGSATDLHLRPGSPAIDAGLDLARSELGPGTLPAPTALDAEDYQRIQGSHVDIGALEGTRLFNDGLE
jgi:hypothetical protein